MIKDEELEQMAKDIKSLLEGAAAAPENYHDDESPPNGEVTYEIARDKSHITFEVMLGPQFKPNPNLEKKDGGNVQSER